MCCRASKAQIPAAPLQVNTFKCSVITGLWHFLSLFSVESLKLDKFTEVTISILKCFKTPNCQLCFFFFLTSMFVSPCIWVWFSHKKPILIFQIWSQQNSLVVNRIITKRLGNTRKATTCLNPFILNLKPRPASPRPVVGIKATTTFLTSLTCFQFQMPTSSEWWWSTEMSHIYFK